MKPESTVVCVNVDLYFFYVRPIKNGKVKMALNLLCHC